MFAGPSQGSPLKASSIEAFQNVAWLNPETAFEQVSDEFYFILESG